MLDRTGVLSRDTTRKPEAPCGTEGEINSLYGAGAEDARALCQIGKEFHGRGWAFGTAGNYSCVCNRDPLHLAITPSGLDKGALSASHILEVGASGEILHGTGRPSNEVAIHLAVVRSRSAGAVLHTHSVWATILSQKYAGQHGVAIQDYEMLKGLDQVSSHAHREWIPIIDNSQDMPQLARIVDRTLAEFAGSHAFLLKGHGLYTWGGSLQQARRHVEILEFLFEVIGRSELDR